MYILGLSGEYRHDGAACIVRDGKLVAFAEEERFAQTKHALGSLPICSIYNCLQQIGITMDEVDCIAVSWRLELIKEDIVAQILEHPLLHTRKKIPVFSAENHLALAASGYYISGMDAALVLVVNGSSDGKSTSIYEAKGGRLKQLMALDESQSLGYFYTTIGIYLGFEFWDESKVMGLSAYGTPRYEFSSIHLDNDGYRMDISPLDKENINASFVRKWMHQFVRQFGTPEKQSFIYDRMTGSVRKEPMQYTQKHKDIACSAQHALEETILHLIKIYSAKTNCRNLVLTGGVAQNSSVNGHIQRSGLVDQMFILPVPHASGGCIGTAMLAYSEQHISVKQKLEIPYCGPSFTEDEIRNDLERKNIKYRYLEGICEEVTAGLEQNKVIGWYQGQGEMGPRTLGNRSIIANPAEPWMHDHVNSKVKYRENWRPVATSVLDEHKNWLFEENCDSPFMIKTLKATEQARNTVSSIVHVDQTVLPQTVTADVNPLWHQLIHRFYKKTGIPALLHTSLNVKGHPICNTPADAINTFYSSGLDMLAMGSFLIEK